MSAPGLETAGRYLDLRNWTCRVYTESLRYPVGRTVPGIHNGSLRAKIQTQTLNLQKAGILTDVTQSPHGYLYHGLCGAEGGAVGQRHSGLCMAGVVHVQPDDSPPWLLALEGCFLGCLELSFWSRCLPPPKWVVFLYMLYGGEVQAVGGPRAQSQLNQLAAFPCSCDRSQPCPDA